MRISIDARSVGTKICGVSRVAVRQIEALAKIDQENNYIVYTNDNDFPIALPANFEVKRTYCDRMNSAHDRRFGNFLRNDRPDVLHVMHSWLPLVIPAGIRKVVTIHDIFTVTDPDFFFNRRPFHHIFRLYFRFLTAMTVRRADTIVTISDFCKREISREFNTRAKVIEVVPNSPGILPKQESSVAMVPEPYLLFLGNFRSYKNVETLVRGFAGYVKNYGGCHVLVLAGNDRSERITRLVDELGIRPFVKFIHRPDDASVDNLFRNADIFVFPSKFEGFGIPPLEAMQYSIPVIISDADALVETSGEAALIFDKNSSDDLAIKIKTLVDDPALQADLIARGHNNVAKYTWEAAANRLLRIYTLNPKET